MALEQIIVIIILVFIAVFAWAIFKKVFKLMFYAGLIILLLIAANLYFIYKDVNDLNENFSVLTKKVILVDEDEVLTGFLLNGQVNFITDEQIEEFSSYLAENNYEEILGESYKLMIFDVGIISDLNVDEIEFNDEIITKDDAITFLKSDADSGEKADLFGTILADHILDSKNPLFFFSQFRKGNLVIYPETALFKTVKFIPLTFIKDIGKKMFEKTKETAKSYVVEEI